MGMPIPDLDDKTFAQLVEEARALIPRYASQWTDHNIHDPGITFIDLFAWLAEMMIYRLNRVTGTQYKKFLRLLGIYPYNARHARVDITFHNVYSEKTIKTGTQMFTKINGEKILFETDETGVLIPVSLEKVITIPGTRTIDNTDANKKEGMYFPAFGEETQQEAELRLGFNETLHYQEIHLVFKLHEKTPLPYPPDSLAWEYLADKKWHPLDIKKDTTSALNQSGKIVFTGPPAMDRQDDLYWVRCRLKETQYRVNPIIDRILLNTVSAIQIETVKKENLGEGSGLPHQTITLKKNPVIKGSLVIRTREQGTGKEKWEQVENFQDSGPADPHYTFNPDTGEITFGNGLNGRILQPSQRIEATYKTTRGEKGNIPKNQVFQLTGGGILQGKNLEKAAGGKDAETLESAKNRAKKALAAPTRAITNRDYEKLALETPGVKVSRAAATANHHPDNPGTSMPGTVTVTAVPGTGKGALPPAQEKEFLKAICNHLDQLRLVTTKLKVISPEYVEISVSCRVKVKEKNSPGQVKKRVEKALEDFLDPLTGGPGKNGWPFGRPVFPSEIYHLIDKVEGVDYASAVSIEAEGEFTKDEEEEIIKINPTALVCSGQHQIDMI